MQNSEQLPLQQKLLWPLFSLRLGVFVVMFVWTIDKFVNPTHSIKIFQYFYGIEGVAEPVVYLFGVLQMVLVLAFLAGVKKRITYGLILFLHGASTLSSYAKYADVFNNLLFFCRMADVSCMFHLVPIKR